MIGMTVGRLGLGLVLALGLAGAGLAQTHDYLASDAAPSEAAAGLAGRLGGTATVLDLVAEGEARPLAEVEVATLPDGTTRLLGWAALTPAPILRRDIRADEDLALVEALQKYLPPDSTILAFPGLSRRLAPLVAARFPLAKEAEPLVMPQPWAGQGDAVATIETAQWGGPAAESLPQGPAPDLTAGLVDALLSEDRTGAARLKIMAGEGSAYVLVHIDDAYQLGLLRPGRMAMTQRLFTAKGFSHDLAREARRWGQENDKVAWAVSRDAEGRLRGHYLAEATETTTLVARLLPFNTSEIDAVPGLRLVWQHEGYWLYRIDGIRS
jgi:hydroxylamine oxidation protein HaoB